MENIQISTNLKNELENKAKENNTDIDNIIKLALTENQQLKKRPDNYIDTSKVSSKKNKGNSYSYSTAIPKPILNKIGLTKGQILYWDIDDYKIIITPELKPEPTPEEDSIKAVFDIFQDMLINGNSSKYTTPYQDIITELEIPTNKKSNEDKTQSLIFYYTETYNQPDSKDGFKKVIQYLLDTPINPEQHEILKEVYEQIIEMETTE